MLVNRRLREVSLEFPLSVSAGTKQPTQNWSTSTVNSVPPSTLFFNRISRTELHHFHFNSTYSFSLCIWWSPGVKAGIVGFLEFANPRL